MDKIKWNELVIKIELLEDAQHHINKALSYINYYAVPENIDFMKLKQELLITSNRIAKYIEQKKDKFNQGVQDGKKYY